MKSSPILGHPPNSFLTRGRRFQSSPIGRVNRGVGNTDLGVCLLKISLLYLEHL